MNEISKATANSRTYSYRKSANRVQSNRSKFAFAFRSSVFLSVVLVFYAKLIAATPIASDNEGITNVSSIVLDSKLLSSSSIPKQTQIGKTTNSTPNCTPPAILEFPSDGLTHEDRRHGWIILHIVVALYCFWLLAAICDDYFVPAIEQICATVSIQRDVVGATFMAAATSSPELFMNCVGTFVTHGDIGVGTIVGSAVFNILAVPACCGIFVAQCIRLDWWPVTRDSLMYCVAVLALIGTIHDDKIMWYEALLLVIGYFFYITVMYYNDKMARRARKLISKYRRLRSIVRPYREVSEFTPLVLGSNNNAGSKCSVVESDAYQSLSGMVKSQTLPNCASSLNSLNSDGSDLADSPWERESRCVHEYLLRWPITLLLWLTIPDSRKHPNWKYITFVLSVSWIGAISYLVAYVITIVGDTLDIPDSVMGLTILAAGMSVPEAVSSIIVTKQGQGAMGISNSIGSNTFDILLCLGLPWFVKAYFLPNVPGEHWVTLNSTGITYSVVFLLTTLFGLYIAFVANKFVLDWKIGAACTIMYLGFLTIAAMIELNVFFPVNLPVCKQ